MYGMLLVSSDENLCTLAMKFVPYTNRDFRVFCAKNRNEAERILATEEGFVDVVVVDHDETTPCHPFSTQCVVETTACPWSSC